MNPEYFQSRKLKSFIRVGQSFIDLKQTIGFSFMDNPEGYLIIQFVYDSGRALNAILRDREDFTHFLFELEPFLDDKNALFSMMDFIYDIERSFKKTNYKNTNTNNLFNPNHIFDELKNNLNNSENNDNNDDNKNSEE